MKLIDADELKIDFGFTWDDIAPTREEMFEIIDRQPTAEPKTGRWKPYPIVDDCIQCSVCGILRMGEPSNFCPNCGAKMEVKKR